MYALMTGGVFKRVEKRKDEVRERETNRGSSFWVSGSNTPITAQSSTPGCWNSTFSTSAGETRRITHHSLVLSVLLCGRIGLTLISFIFYQLLLSIDNVKEAFIIADGYIAGFIEAILNCFPSSMRFIQVSSENTRHQH
jgi:hypothetical protein